MKGVVLNFTPLLTFNTGLNSDSTALSGSLASGFTIQTGNTNGMHILTLANPVATPALANGNYAFKLVASTSQQAALTAYFAAKGWPTNYITQISSEIAGTTPFFFLNAAGGVYTLGDGFTYGLGGGYSAPLRIDDDYPAGTYVYTGTLTGSNGATLPVTVTLIVMRADPE